MHVLLDAGCTVAGACAGFLLYGEAARTPPARPLQPLRPAHASPATIDPSPAAVEPGASAIDLGPPAAGGDHGTTGNTDTSVGPASAAGTGDEAPVPPPATAAGRLAAAAASAGLSLAAAVHFGPTPALAPYAVLFLGLVALSVVDLRVSLLPRRLLYPTAVLVAAGLVGASAADRSWHDLWVAAACAAAAFVLFYLLWYFFPRGMGFGDVRLAGLVGLSLGWLGPLHLYVAMLGAFGVGTVFGLAVMVARGSGRRTRFPFGPSLAAGAVIGVLWGGAFISAWLGQGS